MYVCMYVCMYIHVCMYVCMYRVDIEKGRQRVSESERQSEKTRGCEGGWGVRGGRQRARDRDRDGHREIKRARRCRGLCENGIHNKQQGLAFVAQNRSPSCRLQLTRQAGFMMTFFVFESWMLTVKHRLYLTTYRRNPTTFVFFVWRVYWKIRDLL